MATVTTITEAQSNIGLNALNNGMASIQLVCTYPSFDISFDSTLLEDLYIESLNGFKASESITVSINGTSIGSFTISADTKAIWLSELTGISRTQLSLKTTETIQFDFSNTKLLKFILVSATSTNFISASIVQTSGLDSNMYKLAESEIANKDENSLSALRSVIDTTKTTITGNSTNVVTITNEFETFGSALDKTLVEDCLITFNKSINIGTQIYIKKDGTYLNTYTAKSNVKSIWLSDLLGLSTREYLYNKINETYELTFIYDQQINCQVICGDNTNFISASVASVQLTQNLYELANAKALENVAVSIDDCNFILTYDSYDNSIKSAILQLNDQQEINLSFVTDNSGITPKYLVKLSNVDNLYNVSIDLVMDERAIINYLTLIRDFARKRNELESSTKTS
jgi:hypothetical protein